MAKLLIEVVLDDKGAIKKVGKLEGEIKDVGQAADKAGTKTGGLTKKFGGLNIGAIAVAAGLAAIGKVVGNLVNLFGVQEAAETQLRQTLESTAHAAGLTFDELTKMASGLQEVTKFGDETIITSQALLLTFTNIGRDIFPEVQEAILNVATAMDTDLQSATVQLGKALNDPVLGMTALSRTGITFTQDQKDMVKALVELGDVAGAQAIIMAELNTQFGGQARAAADTFIGSQVQMKNAIGDLGEVLGEAFAPTLRRVNNFIKDAAIATGNWLSALMAIEEILIDTGPIDIFTSSVGELKKEIGLLDELITVLVDDMIIGALSQEAYNEQLAVLANRSRLAKDRLAELEEIARILEAALNDGTLSIEEQIESWATLYSRLKDQLGILPDISAAVSDTDRRIKELTKDLGDVSDVSIFAATSMDSFEDSISRAIVSGDSISDVIKNMVREMVALVIKMKIIKPLMESLFDTKGGGTGGGTGGGAKSGDLLTPAEGAAIGFQIGGPYGAVAGFIAGLIFEHGGSFVVPGSGRTDAELIPIRATAGETVRVTTPEQEAERTGGGDTFVFDMRDSIIGAGAIEEIDARLADLRDIDRSKALKVL